jgi:guanylate kinase
LKKSASKSRTSNNPDAPGTPAESKGFLIILSAPSGCGKTTIVDRLLKRNPEWVRSVSVTTRPARQGEKPGEDYFFVSTPEFRKLVEEGALLEYAKVFDHDYGTPKSFVTEQLSRGKKIILAIDVQGTKKIRKSADKNIPLLTLFVLPPSVKVLRERLEGRNTESPEQIDKRIEVAQDEIKEAGSYDRAVVNQNLEQTVLEIEEAIQSFEKERSH